MVLVNPVVSFPPVKEVIHDVEADIYPINLANSLVAIFQLYAKNIHNNWLTAVTTSS